MKKDLLSRQRPGEQGQTIILVAISLVSLLAMAALAIDIVTLYAARSETQRAADAAALAGAKAVADSGITTLLLTDPNFVTVKPWAENVANAQINAVLQNNLVAGAAPNLASATFDWTRQGNPVVTVKLNSSNLPTFFSKIWTASPPTAAATATAEVYNPANVQNFTPIAPRVVKPWLIANADPNYGGTPFITVSSGAIESNTVVGELLNLTADCASGQPNCNILNDTPPGIPTTSTSGRPEVDYVPAQVATNNGSNVCPACAAGSDYEESIECADTTTSYQVPSCGSGTNYAHWDNTINPGGSGGLSDVAAECLIHAAGTGTNRGQDSLDPSPWPANPMQITAGSGPQIGTLVTTSSSIVTIPIIDTSNTTVFQTGPPYQVTIVGFLQAFIDEVHGGGPPGHRGDIEVHVLNISGCSSSSTNSGVAPIVGGSGTSPIPVRLITPP